MCVKIWGRWCSTAADIVFLLPHCTAPCLIPMRGCSNERGVENHMAVLAGQSGAFLLMRKWLQHQKRQKTEQSAEWKDQNTFIQYELGSTEVLITQGFIKTLITDCRRAAADLLPQLVSILSLCLRRQTFSQTKTDLFLTSQDTHDHLLALQESEQHIAKSWQSARPMLYNYEGLVLEVSLNKVLWNQRREQGDRQREKESSRGPNEPWPTDQCARPSKADSENPTLPKNTVL